MRHAREKLKVIKAEWQGLYIYASIILCSPENTVSSHSYNLNEARRINAAAFNQQEGRKRTLVTFFMACYFQHVALGPDIKRDAEMK